MRGYNETWFDFGKALTGTQTIDGMKYFFNTDGTLKTGWVKIASAIILPKMEPWCPASGWRLMVMR